MKIQHNMMVMTSNRNLCSNRSELQKSLEKLSSGYRINRAGDDAAGLAISEKMRAQITGLNAATKNTRDGMNLLSAAEGALQEVHGMLNRMVALSNHAANSTYENTDRSQLQAEFSQLKREIDRIGSTFNFNGQTLFKTKGTVVNPFEVSGSYKIQSGGGAVQMALTLADPPPVENKRDETLVGAVGLANTTNKLANKIANEMIPNAVKQLLTSFPALANKLGTDQVEIGLRLYSNDKSSVLASAVASYSDQPGTKPISMSVQVNTHGLSDGDLTNQKKMGELQSSIQHELMHSLMQVTLPDGMSKRSGTQYPLWFIEGTAQVAGGGFTSNWNSWLQNPKIGMQEGIFSASDARPKWGLDVKGYGPYAQGYFATLYMGLLAAEKAQGKSLLDSKVLGTVPLDSATTGHIKDGLNLIFEQLSQGKTLDQALLATTGHSQSYIERLFGTPESAASAAVKADMRKLEKLMDRVTSTTMQTIDFGAGSLVAQGGLAAPPNQILSQESMNQSPIFVGQIKVGNDLNSLSVDVDLYNPAQNTPPAGWTPPPPRPIPPGPGPDPGPGPGPTPTPTPAPNPIPPVDSDHLRLQIGAESMSYLDVQKFELSVEALKLNLVDIQTQNDALSALDSIKTAINSVSEMRGEYGAIYNRLEHTIRNLGITTENLTASESSIRDADVASEMMHFTKQSILVQSAQAMLAHANLAPQSILQLLR